MVNYLENYNLLLGSVLDYPVVNVIMKETYYERGGQVTHISHICF